MANGTAASIICILEYPSAGRAATQGFCFWRIFTELEDDARSRIQTLHFLYVMDVDADADGGSGEHRTASFIVWVPVFTTALHVSYDE